jgi:hypothetical protein
MSGILVSLARGLGEGIVTGIAKRFRCHYDAALTAQGRWGLLNLTYWQTIAFPNVDANKVAALYAQAAQSWADVCGINFKPAATVDAAHVVAISAPIDGQWNVLALSELPPTSNFVGILHQRFDQAEFLSDAEMLACMTHELGHILGLGHTGVGTLMAPVLDPAITAPTSSDVAAIQALYGPPAPVAPAPSPTPTPSPPGPIIPGGPGGNASILIDVGIPGVGTLTIAIQPMKFTPV